MKNKIITILIAFYLFYLSHWSYSSFFISAQEPTLQEYLRSNNLPVGEETVDGYRQIYYLFNTQKHFITNSNSNSHMPASSGEYITYVTDINGEGQIFLYHITSGETLQLTRQSTNLQPKVSSNGWVTWEGWIPQENNWQVFLFDLVSIKQLTQGDLSMNPEIEDEQLIYSRRDATGQWRAVAYSALEDKHVDISFGEETREPLLSNEKIFLNQGREEFPLTFNDLFLLDFIPLSGPKTTTTEEIENEIITNLDQETTNATQSASPNNSQLTPTIPTLPISLSN